MSNLESIDDKTNKIINVFHIKTDKRILKYFLSNLERTDNETNKLINEFLIKTDGKISQPFKIICINSVSYGIEQIH